MAEGADRLLDDITFHQAADQVYLKEGARLLEGGIDAPQEDQQRTPLHTRDSLFRSDEPDTRYDRACLVSC